MACPCCQQLCTCSDTCVYSIELVNPLAAKHGTYQCGFPVLSQVIASSLITNLLPFSISGQEAFPATSNQSASVSSNNGSNLRAESTHRANGFVSIPDVSNRFFGFADASITVSCIFNQNFIRRFSVALTCTASGTFYFESAGTVGNTGQWTRGYSGQFEIPSACVSGQGKICNYFGQEVQQITTPLTITLSGGTSSLGSLALTINDGSGEHLEYAKNAVDSILAGLSYTVLITSRQSCNEAP